jgi:hypothetical protein
MPEQDGIGSCGERVCHVVKGQRAVMPNATACAIAGFVLVLRGCVIREGVTKFKPEFTIEPYARVYPSLYSPSLLT